MQVVAVIQRKGQRPLERNPSADVFYGIITAENWALAQFTPPMAGPARRPPRAALVTPELKSSIKRFERRFRGAQARWACRYGIITAENWALAQFTPPMAGPARRTPRAALVTPELKSSIKRFERRFRGAQARWACRYGIITAENWALAQFTPPMARPARRPPRAALVTPEPKSSIRRLNAAFAAHRPVGPAVMV